MSSCNFKDNFISENNGFIYIIETKIWHADIVYQKGLKQLKTYTPYVLKHRGYK